MTRYLTVVILVFQGWAYLANLRYPTSGSKPLWLVVSHLILVLPLFLLQALCLSCGLERELLIKVLEMAFH